MFLLFAVFLSFKIEKSFICRFLFKIFDFLLYTSLGDLYILNPPKCKVICLPVMITQYDIIFSLWLDDDNMLTMFDVYTMMMASARCSPIKQPCQILCHIAWTPDFSLKHSWVSFQNSSGKISFTFLSQFFKKYERNITWKNILEKIWLWRIKWAWIYTKKKNSFSKVMHCLQFIMDLATKRLILEPLHKVSWEVVNMPSWSGISFIKQDTDPLVLNWCNSRVCHLCSRLLYTPCSCSQVWPDRVYARDVCWWQWHHSHPLYCWRY